jgi:hypothetical protein
MGLAFGDALTVEVCHLLEQIVIVQYDRTIRANRQRVFVTGNRYTGIRGRGFAFISHYRDS